MDEKDFREKFPREVEKAIKVILDAKNLNSIPELVFVAAMAELIVRILKSQDGNKEPDTRVGFDLMKKGIRKLLNEELK